MGSPNLLLSSYSGIALETLKLFLVFAILGLSGTIAGLLIIFVATFKLTVLFIPALFAIILAFAEYVYVMWESFKEKKMKRLVVMATALSLIFIVPYTVHAAITPHWSFTVGTDKAVYNLGENATITATLTNNGYITHSFTSHFKDPIIIAITSYSGTDYRWYSRWERVNYPGMEISMKPGRSNQRTIVWNANLTGTFTVYARIWDNNYNVLFEALANITVEG